MLAQAILAQGRSCHCLLANLAHLAFSIFRCALSLLPAESFFNGSRVIAAPLFTLVFPLHLLLSAFGAQTALFGAQGNPRVDNEVCHGNGKPMHRAGAREANGRG